MNGYTLFISYFFVPLSGYSQAIHCNYIHRVELDDYNPYIETIKLNFPNINDFKFLNSNTGTTTGYSTHEFYALVQIVHYNNVTDLLDVKPDSTKWKKYNLTHQITGYPTGTTRLISANDMKNVVFEIPLLGYEGTDFTTYDLSYLTYPSISQPDDLCFGDSTYFFGNVTTKIKADVYSTDISINLPLNEFNSSDNLTWNGVDTVYITEIGLYDSNKNLVAIGKLNNPVPKNATISRTILFAIDF